jgi:LuxR family maltose regulon positive regulatory protein
MTGAQGNNIAGVSQTGERAIVLATKLNSPHISDQLIQRTTLLDAMAVALRRKITLVSAPAGWGKTTLLAQWVVSHTQAAGGPVYGWLSIDPPDNDPVRFWTYVISALHKASPALGGRALELVAMGANSLLAALPTLLNEVAAAEDQLVMILDDYHLITNPAVHEQMEFVLTRMPTNLHVVLATRADPALPLARFRARGELTEVRGNDLRFHPEEAGQLFNAILHLGLADDDVELLYRRTEGWAAGLYLAALSLSGRSDADAVIKTFDGDHRYIADYLMAEVLDRQPENRRRFLLRTSILRKLNGALCDAVLHDTDSASVLEAIERENLFVIPLDLSRRWYRYHHLLAELLRVELHRSEPDLVPELHRRAAAWSTSKGLIDAAVYHLTAAGDITATSQFIAEHWVDEFNADGLSTVTGWLDSLPDKIVRQDPRLSVPRAWIAVNEGRVNEAAGWIDAIEARADADAAAGGTIAAQAAILRAIHAFKIGDITTCRETARRATGLDLGDAPLARSGLYCVYGNALYFSGHRAAAQAAYRQAAAHAERIGDRRYLIYALGYLALIAAEAGDITSAEHLVRRANGGGAVLGAQEYFVGVMVCMAAAEIFTRRGDVSAAADAVGMAVASARHGGAIPEIVKALLAQAEIAERIGDHDTARTARHEASSSIEQRHGSGMDPALLLAAGAHPDVSQAPPAAPSNAADKLTARERQVLSLLATPLSRREIGLQLHVSVNTIKTQQRSLYRKLGVVDRDGAVERARTLGLL